MTADETRLPPMGLRPRNIFTCYKFVLYLRERDEVVPLQSCFNDPFTAAVWLGRAHVMGEPTLANRLMDTKQIEIYMWPVTSGFGKVRRIKVSFASYRWLPLDLDGRRNEVAMEWVALQQGPIDVGPVDDLEPEDVPPAISQWFSPTHAEEA